MTGTSDPRLLESALVNEARLADGGGAREAREHRAEDFEAASERARAESRTNERPAPGPIGRLLRRVCGGRA